MTSLFFPLLFKITDILFLDELNGIFWTVSNDFFFSSKLTPHLAKNLSIAISVLDPDSSGSKKAEQLHAVT